MDFGAGMSLLPRAIKPAVQHAGVSPVRVLGQQPVFVHSPWQLGTSVAILWWLGATFSITHWKWVFSTPTQGSEIIHFACLRK